MAYDFCTLHAVEGRLCLIDAGRDHFNQGGALEAIVIPQDKVVSYPEYDFAFDSAELAQMSGTIVLRAGAEAYRFRFSPDTGGFTEQMQETDDGIYFDQLFNISIPKDRPEQTWLKYRMRWGRYTIVYRDANGITKTLKDVRVKFDLDIGKARSEYNGHVMYARRSHTQPALHFNISSTLPLTDIFEMAALVMQLEQFTLTAGFEPGKQLTLAYEPASQESAVLIYNNALKLRLGNDYTLTGKTITLQFSDIPAEGEAGSIQVMYATNAPGTDIAAWAQHTATKTASYSSGETITLPSSPIDDDSLLVYMNDIVALRRGTDYTLSGDTVTLLFGGSPTPSDQDVFSFFYVEGGSPLAITGWKQYLYETPGAESSGFIFSLPHTPLTDSLLVWMGNSFLLREGVHYNLTDNEIQILFAVDESTAFDCWYAY